MARFSWGGSSVCLLKLCILPGTTPYSRNEPIETFDGLGLIEDLRHFSVRRQGQPREIVAEIVVAI